MKVGDRLPDLELEKDGQVAPLPSPRLGAPLLLMPPVRADTAPSYLRSFLEGAASLDLWGGRPLVVVGSHEEAAKLSGGEDGRRVAVDPSGKLRATLGLREAEWALVVADRWGIVYHWAHAESPEELPDLREIQEWAKFLATQCPECGVIDQPAPEG